VERERERKGKGEGPYMTLSLSLYVCVCGERERGERVRYQIRSLCVWFPPHLIEKLCKASKEASCALFLLLCLCVITLWRCGIRFKAAKEKGSRVIPFGLPRERRQAALGKT